MVGDHGRMTCEEYRTALSAELDGEATGQGELDVRRHLSDCAECGRWLAACWTLESVLVPANNRGRGDQWGGRGVSRPAW